MRSKDADKQGYVPCYTCGKRFYWREVDAGHFIKRGHWATRYDPMNVKPQCRADNRFKGGMQDEFALHIIKDHGQEEFEKLMARKWEIAKLEAEDFEKIIEQYAST